MSDGRISEDAKPGSETKTTTDRVGRSWRRRAKRWVIGILTTGFVFLLLILVGILYVSQNRWRVIWHHGMSLPASAREFECTGCTAFPILTDGASWARFVIDSDDLPVFLQQFREGTNVAVPSGGFTRTSKPWSQTIGPDGEAWGPSPTGRDLYGVKWHTTRAGVVIELRTDWN